MRTQKHCLAAVSMLAFVLVSTLPAAAERPSDALAALHPDAYLIVDGPVELIVPLDSAVPFVETAFETDLGDRVVATGSRLFSGDLVVQGALLNRGEGNLLLRFADGERALLEPGMGVVVRESQAEEALISSCSACSVSCGPGFYACCKRETLFSCASCTCKPNGSTNTCHSGGPGATSCSVGTASAASEASAGEPDLSVD